jgi:hypothetical protein
MPLTTAAINAAKGHEKSYKLTDSGGLHLLILPSGSKYWRMHYRFNDKQKSLAFGVWPDVTLADARAKRDAARRLVANGIDPGEKAKLDKAAASIAAANTFEAVANELLAKAEREGLSAITLKKNRWLIGFITPVLGRRPIAEITAHELLSVLRSVETRGRHETAKRMRAICSQVFRYAIATARAERDVAADLKGALTVPKVTHRAAITTPTGAGSLLRAIEAFDGHLMTHAALRLLPHVFVRPGELRYAEWADFDVDKALWTIPAHKTKMRPYMQSHCLAKHSTSSPASKRMPHSALISSLRFGPPSARCLRTRSTLRCVVLVTPRTK